MKATKEVYEKFRVKLIKALPMDDVIFLGLLRREKMLHGDLSEQIQKKETVKEKAAWFLDKAIEPSLCTSDFKSLKTLLTVMSDEEDLDNIFLKEFATTIKQELDKQALLIPKNVTG